MTARRLFEQHVSGLDCVRVASELLQRVRLAHPTAGVWDAADVQWWWRRPRSSDALQQPVLSDADGPVAMALLTQWVSSWQLDPLVTPGFDDDVLAVAIDRAVARTVDLGVEHLETLIDDADEELSRLLTDAGFVPDAEPAGGTCWMDATSLTDGAAVPEGYEITDRLRSPDGAHWLEARNGPDVEARLREVSLYDPELDLAVRTVGGRIAAYSLLWFEPVTAVGMIEPMRTEDEHQRRGLGQAVLSFGLRRLVDRGARRLKVGYATDAARALYSSLGVRPTQTVRLYRREAH